MLFAIENSYNQHYLITKNWLQTIIFLLVFVYKSTHQD
jgi:hypothetical protein